MRHMSKILLVIAILGLATPALAQSTTTEHKETTTKTQRDQKSMESHLKAAGYDLMQARQMIQSKDNAKAREHMTSARSHIKMAEEGAPTTVANQIRKIETQLEQAEKVARTDMNKAGQQVAKADNELKALIKQHGGGR